MSRRVLVTGATGFIGRQLTRTLQARGEEVHAIARSSPVKPSSLVWHSVDLFDRAAVITLLREIRADVLVHLAWLTTPGRYLISEENDTWLRASVELIEGFAAMGGSRAVWAGTCLEYDIWAEAPFVEGETALRPDSSYAKAKHSLAERVRAATGSWGVEYAWGRIFNVYGPGEHPSRVIAGTIRTLAQGRTMSLSEGLQRRDFLHVADVAEGLRVLVDSAGAGPVNICSGEGVAVRDVALRIGELMHRPDLIELASRPSSAPEPPAIVGSNRLLRSLGWAQQIDLESGIADMIRRLSQKSDV